MTTARAAANAYGMLSLSVTRPRTVNEDVPNDGAREDDSQDCRDLGDDNDLHSQAKTGLGEGILDEIVRSPEFHRRIS